MADVFELRESLQTSLEWKINNFLDLPKEIDYFLESHSFSLSKARWYLRIYPNGESIWLTSGYVGFYLHKEESPNEHRVAFRLEIKRINGSTIYAETEHTFEKKRSGQGSRNICKISELKDIVTSDGILTLFCNVRVVDKLLVSSTTETASQTQTSVNATAEVASQSSWSDGILILLENLKELYLSSRCADVRIIVKGREFLAHRNVLAARSTVFSAMLSCEMAEKNNGVIEITDCDPHSFEDFLIFLYTGDLNIVSTTNVTSLYETSEKYDLKDLKAECVRHMIHKLSVDSFCDVLHLASLYNETNVLDAATNYFLKNAKDILVTLKWQNFNDEYPFMGNELFLKYVNKK